MNSDRRKFLRNISFGGVALAAGGGASGNAFASNALGSSAATGTASTRTGSTRPQIPFTGTFFERSEYVKRQQRVLRAAEIAGLDAVLVTAPSHLRYLTGYSGTATSFAPHPLIISPGREPTFVVRKFDEENIRANSCIDEIVPYLQRSDFLIVCSDVLRQLKLHNKRVGMELDRSALAPVDVMGLQAKLPDLKIVDATKVVTAVSAVKSDLEILALREAATVTDFAMSTFYRIFREGITEAEVAATVRERVQAKGGELSSSFNVPFGERLRLPHAIPAKYPIKINDAAFIELSGVVKDYAAPLCRSAVVGRHPGLESLHKVAEEAVEVAAESLKPGATTGGVNAAITSVIERRAPPEALRNRTGYQIGVYWGTRGDLSIDPGTDDVIEANMSFHVPIILFDERGFQTGCSESFLIGDNGAEILSKIPRTMFRV